MPPDWLAAERDEVEAEFFRQTRGTVDRSVIDACWTVAAAAERSWHEHPLERPAPIDAGYAAGWDFCLAVQPISTELAQSAAYD